MTRVVGDISISLDGFVSGPNAGPANGLGDGGEALHTWAFSDDPVDREQLRSATASSGAVVLGRNLFDVVDGPQGWNDEVGYGAREVGRPPFFVVTSDPPVRTRLAFWTFVTTGLRDAVAQAREAAGPATGTATSSSWAAVRPSGPPSTPGCSTGSSCTSPPSSSATAHRCSSAVRATRWCSGR